jgi:hypothetical protein
MDSALREFLLQFFGVVVAALALVVLSHLCRCL